MGRFFFWLLIWVIAVLILLFFPVYLALDAHYDMNRKKFAFMTKAYGFIKLIGGYVATYQGGLAVHISDKKAILIPYSEVEGERKRLSVLRTFRLKTLSSTTETGAEYLFLTALAQMFFRAYFLIKGGKEEKLENNFWLTDGDVLRISVNCSLRFNLYIIIRNLLVSLKEKVKYYVRQKQKN